ncbi:MAG: hypothetical protein AUJ92_17225 [Armatimonadetes bacterium CG2_30_59_28]|nr:MAG: hypothetical protein AUJ92_17225 [Armatimonadetes bacterium CG2_30_59_28]
MRNMLTMMFVLLINTTVCRADDVIKNGDFSQPAGNDARMPAAWRLPEGGRWQRDLAGGPAEKACLRYDGRDTATAPVVQVCDFCTPNATYELSAMVKSDGQAQPVFRVIDKHTQKQLAVVTGTTDKDWRRVTTSFNTVDADIVVEIYGNPSDISGKPEAPGRCWVADVRIAKAATTPAPQTMPDLGENLALGKPYTMTPPNYSLCADADDRVQLTDGAYTDGHFWTRRTTVGWSGVTPKFVTIDLGADLPVKGVSFSTAAGVAEVHWPTQILIFVSSDGKEWREVADLVALSAQREPLPDYGAYYVRRLWTDQLRTHGRYLQLCVESDRRYTFADEIEVYRGNDEWLASAYSGKAIPNVEAYMDTRRITGLIQAQFRRDLDAVRADIADLPANARAPFAQQADKLAARIDTTPPIPMEGFRRELCEFDAVLPMTDLERDIFKLQAAVWRTLKKPLLRVWWKQRWDPLDPSEEPQSAAAAPVLQVHTMTNEHRADVFNLTNASAGDQRVRMRIAGLPGGTNPDYVKVHEVPSVGTRWFVAVAAALPEAERSGDDYVVTVPSGMTRQVWLSFNPNKLPAQFYQGKVEIQSSVAGKLEVPIHLRVYPLRFPDETSLLLGGWTYTNTESIYGVTLRNRQAVIRHLQERFVNAPWATSSALPEGAYDAAGNMTQKPDTSNLDNWVALWPKAKL